VVSPIGVDGEQEATARELPPPVSVDAEDLGRHPSVDAVDGPLEVVVHLAS
jgi:hypothetical protein